MCSCQFKEHGVSNHQSLKKLAISRHKRTFFIWTFGLVFNAVSSVYVKVECSTFAGRRTEGLAAACCLEQKVSQTASNKSSKPK